MKKVFWIISFALLAFSCSVEEPATPAKNNDNDNTPHARVYARTEPVVETAANIEDEESKTFANSNMKVVWNANDEISVFLNDNGNQQYRFTGDTGDEEGVFSWQGGSSGSSSLSNVYSVYPYNENTTIDADGVITYNLPSEQIYRENMFGLGANTMVSASTGADNLVFKNLCGYLILKLYGENVKVSAITLEGRNREPLSGPVKITATNGGTPSFTFDSGYSTSITLKCETPVTLGSTAETATPFWFVVPPTTFTNGIQITVISESIDAATENITYKKFQKQSKAITIPRNTTYRLKALEVVPVNPTPSYTVVNYWADDQIDPNPDGFIGYGVNLSIASHDFVGGRGTITLNGELREISNYCFADCGLTSISLPTSLTTIGNGAFAGCYNLESVDIPLSVTTIGEDAFYECSGLQSITFRSYIRTIGERAFSGCYSLMLVTIPDSVTTIGDYAFSSCSSLQEVTVGSSVTTIGAHAFEYTPITSIDIPHSVTTIGDYAFNETSLESVIIGDSVRTIGREAFCWCCNLATVDFGNNNSLITIGYEAFGYCAITEIDLPDSVTTIGDLAFFSCENLTDITIPDSVTTIGGGAFSSCTSITHIDIPDFVTTIGSSAFHACYCLQTANLGCSVAVIGDRAFDDCRQLKSITIQANTPPTLSGDNVFRMVGFATDEWKIYVPSASVNTYKYATGWSTYSDKIEAIQ